MENELGWHGPPIRSTASPNNGERERQVGIALEAWQNGPIVCRPRVANRHVARKNRETPVFTVPVMTSLNAT